MRIWVTMDKKLTHTMQRYQYYKICLWHGKRPVLVNGQWEGKHCENGYKLLINPWALDPGQCIEFVLATRLAFVEDDSSFQQHILRKALIAACDGDELEAQHQYLLARYDGDIPDYVKGGCGCRRGDEK